MRLRTSASAVAVDADGARLDGEVGATAPRVRIDVLDDGGLPGFGEVLSGSWNALKTLGILIALGLIALAPFALVAAIVGPIVWFGGRRLLRRDGEPNVAVSQETAIPDVENADAETTVSF